MPHDEWTKSLADGRIAKYVYDEVAGVCSVSIVIGEYVKSHSSLEGPLTREQVEELFDREIRRAKGAP